jgi:hypothetical protein
MPLEDQGFRINQLLLINAEMSIISDMPLEMLKAFLDKDNIQNISNIFLSELAFHFHPSLDLSYS